MGNASRKVGELPEDHSVLTENQIKLIKDTWGRFCESSHEYGVLLFVSLFTKHPEYVFLFPRFRGKRVEVLKSDPTFRAHGCAIGYHVTSLVDSLSDPAAFEVLARRNATEHLTRPGVKPHHFEMMAQCMVDVLRAHDEKRMTPAAAEAWQKFLSYFVAIVKDVYEQAAVDRCDSTTATFLATVTIDEANFTPGIERRLESGVTSNLEPPTEAASAKPSGTTSPLSSTAATTASPKKKRRSSSGASKSDGKPTVNRVSVDHSAPQCDHSAATVDHSKK